MGFSKNKNVSKAFKIKLILDIQSTHNEVKKALILIINFKTYLSYSVQSVIFAQFIFKVKTLNFVRGHSHVRCLKYLSKKKYL